MTTNLQACFINQSKRLVFPLLLLSLFAVLFPNILEARDYIVYETIDKFIPSAAPPAILTQIEETPEILEQKIRKAIQSQIEAPEDFEMQIDKSLDKYGNLHFNKIDVKVQNGFIEGLLVHHAHLSLNDLYLNLEMLFSEEKIRVLNKALINMHILIKEDALNDFVKTKSKKINIQNPKIRLFNNNEMELSGSTKYGFIRASFWTRGSFEIRNEKELHIRSRRFKVNRANMPRNIINSLLRKLNPIFEFKDEFLFKVNLKEIRITGEHIEITSFSTH